MSQQKEQKNLRLSPECHRLLALIANADGIGESAVIELIVRKEARVRGLIGDTWGARDTVKKVDRHDT